MSAADWQAVKDLCCLTGDGGHAIARSRWPLFAEAWIGPYSRLRPRWTLIAASAGEVVGYLTGCPDTASFFRAARWRVTLPLALRVLAGRYPWNEDARRLVRQAFGLEMRPESRLLRAMRGPILREYPAHLHVNVAAAARARGVGRVLVESYLEALIRERVAGVHLFCGSSPVGFYERLGFTVLERWEVRPQGWVHAMGRSLRDRRREEEG